MVGCTESYTATATSCSVSADTMRTRGSAALCAREAALLVDTSAITPVMKILLPALIMTCSILPAAPTENESPPRSGGVAGAMHRRCRVVATYTGDAAHQPAPRSCGRDCAPMKLPHISAHPTFRYRSRVWILFRPYTIGKRRAEHEYRRPR